MAVRSKRQGACRRRDAWPRRMVEAGGAERRLPVTSEKAHLRCRSGSCTSIGAPSAFAASRAESWSTPPGDASPMDLTDGMASAHGAALAVALLPCGGAAATTAAGWSAEAASGGDSEWTTQRGRCGEDAVGADHWGGKPRSSPLSLTTPGEERWATRQARPKPWRWDIACRNLLARSSAVSYCARSN